MTKKAKAGAFGYLADGRDQVEVPTDYRLFSSQGLGVEWFLF